MCLLELNNGTKIPSLGLGTWPGTWQPEPGVVADVITHAVKVSSYSIIIFLYILCSSSLSFLAQR